MVPENRLTACDRQITFKVAQGHQKVSLDGVAPSRMVGVSASVNLPLHHKVQKFSSGTGSPGWSWKKDRKTVVVVVVSLKVIGSCTI